VSPFQLTTPNLVAASRNGYQPKKISPVTRSKRAICVNLANGETEAAFEEKMQEEFHLRLGE